MQSVLAHLASLPNLSIGNKNQDELNKIKAEMRSDDLRIKHIAVIVFMVLTASTALSLTLNGIVVLVKGEGLALALAKLITGGLLGVITIDLFQLRAILFNCYNTFNEVAYHIGHHQSFTDEMKQRITVFKDQAAISYKSLIILDRVIDIFNPPQPK